MKNSLSNYDMANPRALDGLLAFRIDDKASREIEYSKVYSEFHKLRAGYASVNDGYGLGAIDLYVNRVIQYPCEVSPIDRWYVIANYLRESAKLMRMRYCILEKEFQEKQIEKSLNTFLLKKLVQDTDILFFTISRLQMKGSIASPEIIDKLSAMQCRLNRDGCLLLVCRLFQSSARPGSPGETGCPYHFLPFRRILTSTATQIPK